MMPAPLSDSIRLVLNLTTADVRLVRSALLALADQHEQEHGCAEATRARAFAHDLEPFTREIA